VNTASKCGFTPQYKGLQALYEDKKDEGLVIVGVPSNDFGSQEPGTEEEVKTFCEINYGVTFPLTKKYVVKGAASTLSMRRRRRAGQGRGARLELPQNPGQRRRYAAQGLRLQGEAGRQAA
jgi:hypothetical protein